MKTKNLKLLKSNNWRFIPKRAKSPKNGKFYFSKSSEFQNVEQKLYILLNKFDWQISINNHFINNISENQNNILNIDQKLDYINIKIDLNPSQNTFITNEKINFSKNRAKNQRKWPKNRYVCWMQPLFFDWIQ